MGAVDQTARRRRVKPRPDPESTARSLPHWRLRPPKNLEDRVIRTFLDASVLIAAIRGTSDIADRALDLLNDSERVFVASDFVRLDVLPKAVYFQQQAEVEFPVARFRAWPETL